MNENEYDFRPLAPGWYTESEPEDGPHTVRVLVPCPGLIRHGGAWRAAAVGVNGEVVPTWHRLVLRPDLAHLPGDLEVRVIGGVEFVRPSVPTTRRVLGPDTPFANSKSAYSAEA